MPLKLMHTEIISELQVDVNAETFPQDLREKIESLNAMVAAHDAAPDEATAKKIETLSAKLWHAIKDWEEKELPEDVEPAAEPEPAPVEPVVVVTPVEPAPVEPVVVVTPVEPAPVEPIIADPVAEEEEEDEPSFFERRRKL